MTPEGAAKFGADKVALKKRVLEYFLESQGETFQVQPCSTEDGSYLAHVAHAEVDLTGDLVASPDDLVQAILEVSVVTTEFLSKIDIGEAIGSAAKTE